MSTRPVLLPACLAVFAIWPTMADPATPIENHKVTLARSCARDKPAGFNRNSDAYRSAVRHVIKKGEEQRLAKLRTANNWIQHYRTTKRPLERKKWKVKALELEECRGFYVPGLTKSADTPLSTGLVGTVGFYVSILQVIGPDTMIVKRLKKRVWLAGFSTEGFADDDTFSVGHIVYVSGTHQYTAVTGAAQTIMKIEPFPVDWRTWRELAIEERLIEDPAKAREKAQRAEQELWRTWTAGKHTTVAKFGGMIGQSVRLTKKNGKTVSVPLGKLSDADRKWITDRK